MPFPLIPAIAAAAPAIGSALQGLFGGRAQSKANEANMKLAEYQYSKQLEMWHLQNAYNAPSQQMARFKQAGLNPNLIYGQGNAGNASTMPQYQAPRMSPVNYMPDNIPNVLSLFQDFQMKQAQTDNLRAQNDLIKSNAAIKGFEADYADSTFSLKRGLLRQKHAAGQLLPDVAQEQLRKIQLDNQLKSELMPFSLQYASGRNRQQQVAISKMLQDTELQKLKTDWYVTQMFGNIAGQAVNALRKFTPGMSRGGANPKYKPTAGATGNPFDNFGSGSNDRLMDKIGRSIYNQRKRDARTMYGY